MKSVNKMTNNSARHKLNCTERLEINKTKGLLNNENYGSILAEEGRNRFNIEEHAIIDDEIGRYCARPSEQKDTLYDLCKSATPTEDLDDALQTGSVYNGIFWPSVTSKCTDPNLKPLFIQYTRRQRVGSIVMVHLGDLLLKIILLAIWMHRKRRENNADVIDDKINASIYGLAAANLTVCVVSCWRCISERYLHWIAVTTWLLLNIQGIVGSYYGFLTDVYLLWYILFIMYVSYGTLPLPSLAWSIAASCVTAFTHMLTKIFTKDEDEMASCKMQHMITDAVLYGAINLSGVYIKNTLDWRQIRIFMQTRLVKARKTLAHKEHVRHKKLLNSALPKFMATEIIAQELKEPDSTIRYVHKYKNVSILFADIVRFTELASQCSAQDLVKLLDDLFTSFDQLADKNNCLRVKLLGDCYYCVSGLPIARADHADCCVNLGLQMIKTIRKVTHDKQVPLDMRIGVHSGYVLCGILGLVKWQFDLWSHDVTVANQMESGGQSGRVHISHSTRAYLLGKYNMEQVSDDNRSTFLLEHAPITFLVCDTEPRRFYRPDIQSEKLWPIASTETQPLLDHVEEDPITTVDHLALKMPSEKVDAMIDQHSVIWNSWRMYKEHINFFTLEFYDRDLEERFFRLPDPFFKAYVLYCLIMWGFIITVLQFAQLSCLEMLWPLLGMCVVQLAGSVVALCEEFQSAPRILQRASTALSASKERRGIFLSIVLGIMVIGSSLNLTMCPHSDTCTNLQRNNQSGDKIVTGMNTEAALRATLTEDTTSISPHIYYPASSHFSEHSDNKSDFLDTVIIRKNITSNFKQGVTEDFTTVNKKIRKDKGKSVHSVFGTNILSQKKQKKIMYLKRKRSEYKPKLNEFHEKITMNNLNHSQIVRINIPNDKDSMHKVDNKCSKKTCYPAHKNLLGLEICVIAGCAMRVSFLMKTVAILVLALIYWIIISVVYTKPPEIASEGQPLFLMMQLVISLFILMKIFYARTVDMTARMDFLWKCEAEEQRVVAEKSRQNSEQLLQCILPDHVIQHYIAKDRSTPKDLYSKSYEKVGVMFASIPDFHEFHSKNCREGVESIMLLNEIIVNFDRLLDEKHIEKIKTIGSTYIAASGLHPQQTPYSEILKHICTLVDFAFAMQDQLEIISKNRHNDSLKLRIGISCGPLVGGVITKKHVYDIWGDTVNKASRMESTGITGRIQVTKETTEFLKDSERYLVLLRGWVNVKGKGRMETYWVEKKL